ncbi:hypothetical protein AV530_015886 [Patagioenas fasciata monilis]|uniref:Uncharacterized protein n=1 Tax=Patagioenas fasciata monilis TaxID=372326 RepID=A0A1V4KJ30_PATFA|nr:hypothetical protein AV530_015886 [Patagioenas fasciata monilis]
MLCSCSSESPQGLAGIKDLSFLVPSLPCCKLSTCSEEAPGVCSVWLELHDLKCFCFPDRSMQCKRDMVAGCWKAHCLWGLEMTASGQPKPRKRNVEHLQPYLLCGHIKRKKLRLSPPSWHSQKGSARASW